MYRLQNLVFQPYSGQAILGLLTDGRGQKGPLSKLCHICYSDETWYSIPYIKTIQKMYGSRNTPLEFNGYLLYQEMHIQITFWQIVYNSFIFFYLFIYLFIYFFFEYLKVVLIKMDITLMMSAKLATAGFLKINIF